MIYLIECLLSQKMKPPYIFHNTTLLFEQQSTNNKLVPQKKFPYSTSEASMKNKLLTVK